MILVITEAQDVHVDYLVERMSLAQRKALVRFNTEDFPTKTKLSLGDRSSISLHGEEHELSSFSSVWYRRPKRPIISSSVKNQEVIRYCESESWDMLLAAWEWLDCLWVSKPSSIKSASHKWHQLSIAKKLGMRVPETLITNDPVQAQAFCRQVGEAIVKPVVRPHVKINGSTKMVYANPILPDDPRICDVELSPMTFQEYIPKALELRITVVGEKVFACAIHSQATEGTRHDWRHYDLGNTPHQVWSLPPEVEQQCRELVCFYHLSFGAIDMVLTPAGEYVFLEINPNGQWLWIEELTKLPISTALIELLFSRE